MPLIYFNVYFRTTQSSASKMTPNKVQLDITQGRIVGVESNLPNGKPFLSFQGIPYAQPPVGELRFMVMILTNLV